MPFKTQLSPNQSNTSQLDELGAVESRAHDFT